jgi:hypothetical protein
MVRKKRWDMEVPARHDDSSADFSLDNSQACAIFIPVESYASDPSEAFLFLGLLVRLPRNLPFSPSFCRKAST